MVGRGRGKPARKGKIIAALIAGAAAIGMVAVMLDWQPRHPKPAAVVSAAPNEPTVSAMSVPEMDNADVAGARATPVSIPEVPGFEYLPQETDEEGWRRYLIRIKSGGSPNLVAMEKLTPLFAVAGQDGPTYVWNQFSSQNPHRRPNTIQPGDEFTLRVPPETFMVLSQEDVVEHYGGMARVRLYTSEERDILRYYLTDPFPIVYELQHSGNHLATIVFHRELAYQLTSGRTDTNRLAQLIYRVEDPDIYQVEATKDLVGKVLAGQHIALEVDRSRRYLDPVREAMQYAASTERVTDRDRSHLTRAIFSHPSESRFAAIEDSLGTATNVEQLASGQVFRIEYYWDGKVRVYYKTGADDAMGKRKPDLLRENERWAALYERVLGPFGDWPVRWSTSEPADLDRFPSARDPRFKSPSEEHAYDYLVADRVLVLTFRPIRNYVESQQDNAVFSGVKEARERFRDQIEGVFGLVEQLTGRSVLSTDPLAPRAANTEE